MKQLLLTVGLSSLCIGAMAQVQVDTFLYTGAVQTFTVPPCVTTIHIEARGAQGGAVTGQAPLPPGGRGAIMSGDFAVNPGDVLSIIVGQRGNSDPSSSGGGGGSGVNFNNTALIVAGGGAGVDFQDPNYAGQDAVTTTNGVDGNSNPGSGGVGGGSGLDYAYTSSNISRGGNGWNANNLGSTGVDGLSTNTTWTAGSWGIGGGGGSVGYGYCNCGGGGGGYSGGGSANINTSGGGGGSYNAGTNQVNYGGPSGNQGDGKVLITYTVGVGVPASPTGIAGTAFVCEGSAPLTYFISSVAGATGYTWSVTGSSTIISGQGTTSIDVQPGTGTSVISVTADNACGSSAPASFTLTIQAAPVIGLGSDITQCGGNVTLDANNAGSTFMWNDGSTNQTLFVDSSGTYSVNVTNAQGCGSNDTINVTIYTPPSVMLGADTTVCGSSIILDAQNAGATYAWSDSSTAQTLTVTTSGSYSVVVTDANGCTSFDEITVTVSAPPTVTASAPAAICIDDALFPLSGSPSGGVWTGPGVTGNNFDPVAAGSGTHTLTYTYIDSLSGCSNFDTASVFVDLCLGMSAGNTTDFVVSPNPNNGSFVLDFGTAQNNTLVELVDISGRTVQSNTISGSRANVNCEAQPAGVYFVRVTANGSTTMKKITIVK